MIKVLTTFTILFSSFVYASDIKIINIGAATSPTALFANAYSKNLSIPNTFVPAKSCKDAMAIAEKEDSVMIVPNDIYLQSLRLGQECSPKLEPSKILLMSDAYFEVCKKSGSNVTLRDKGVTVGRASVHPIREWAADFNKRNSTSVKGIAFSGSRTVLTGVLNGDVNWGVIAREIAEPAVKEGKIECPYNTEASSIKSLHRSFDMINEEYVLKYLLITNIKNPVILEDLRRAAKNPKFLEYLSESKHSNIVTEVSKNHVDLYLKSISDLNLLLDSFNHK
jgi:hypothetical protein